LELALQALLAPSLLFPDILHIIYFIIPSRKKILGGGGLFLLRAYARSFHKVYGYEKINHKNYLPIRTLARRKNRPQAKFFRQIV
jgi:hypothetical protein